MTEIKAINEKEMSFFDHLEELRWHFVRSIGAIIVGAIIFFLLKDFVFQQIIFAPKHKSFLTYQFFCGISELTCFGPPEFDLITREMGEQFFTHLKVSIWLGFIAMFPYVFYEFWKFIEPGLYAHEKKAAGRVVLSCTLLFYAGVLFGYYIISPFAITFLVGYQVGPDAISSPTLASYTNYMSMFTLPTGFLFELPVLVFFLSKIGVVTPEGMRKFRKHAFVIILILAAIITPPDILTQFLIGVPIFLLYEFSIQISSRVVKSLNKKLALEAGNQ